MSRASHQKNNGVFHTPKELAHFAANLAIERTGVTVLDPCYGEGSLLLAAHERLLKLGCLTPHEYLFGYDIAAPAQDAQASLAQFLEGSHLIQIDFFAAPHDEWENKVDIILMNPPFVRHHLIPKDTQQELQKTVKGICSLPATSDLWAYFLLHGSQFIRKDGSLAAILPWSFLRADYAKPVREFLLDRFRTLKVIVIGKRLFERAEERVLVLFASGFGYRTSEIGIHYSFEIPLKETNWMSVDRSTWLESPWKTFLSSDMSDVLSVVSDRLGFEPLSQFAKVRIGTVTGANDFFILGKDRAEALKLPVSMLKPIVKHSSRLDSLAISVLNDIDDVLLLIPEDTVLPKAVRDHIRTGEKDGLNERYHTRKRPRWYSIPPQVPPDAFLPYMTKEVPFLVSNPDGLLSTNTVHGVYFLDGVRRQTKKCIQLSMLTSISQLSVELAARTYGGGVLKIEPSAAGKILVYPGRGRAFPADLEHELNDLLLAGKRFEAVNCVDRWVMSNLGVPREEMNLIIECYQKLRYLRLGEEAIGNGDKLRL